MNHLRDGSRSSKKAGSDNGSEFTGADIDALMTKYGVTHEYGIKGCPMSQSLAESHVGVWKRWFASYVRARMDAIGEEDEESKSAIEIKQSWPDIAATLTSSVNSAWMQQHPRPLSRVDVHYGDAATTQRFLHSFLEFFKRKRGNFQMFRVKNFREYKQMTHVKSSGADEPACPCSSCDRSKHRKHTQTNLKRELSTKC